MLFARQSTAIIVTVGPVLDSTGVAVTDSVVGDFLISKNGAAPAALNGSATLTHRHTGNYSLSLTATDVNTVGTVEITCSDTTNACPIKEIQVIEEAAYDVMFAASAPGPASPTNITAGTITTATNVTTVNGLAAGVITAAAVATGAIDADALAADAAAEIADAVWDEDATAHQTQGTFGQAIGDPAADTSTIWGLVNTNLDAAVSSRLSTAGYTAPDNASISAILADTGTDGVVVAAGSKTGYTLTSGEQDTIVDKVWDEATSGHQTAGTTGKALTDAGAAGDPWATSLPGAYGAGTAGNIVGNNLNATVSSRLATAGYTAPLDAAGTRSAVGLASANLDTQLSTIDTVVDSILVDTAEIGVAGAGLTAVASQASVNTVDTVVDGIKAKTDSLTFTVAGSVDANVQQVNDVTIVGNGSTVPFNV